MATMTTPENQAETVRLAFDVGDRTERLRIESGIRSPHQWVKKTAMCRGSHADAYCRACYEKIAPDTKMVWEEDLNCHIQARRNRYWHPQCHPAWVNREFDRIRKEWTAKLAS